MKKLISACSLALCLWACSHNSGWTVKGTIENTSADDRLALYGFNATSGSWYLIDSVDISGNGTFSYTATQASPYSDVYSIGYNGKNIFFPVDSAETVTITADASHFDKKFSITGSPLAESMHNVDIMIQKSVDQYGVAGVRTDSILR